MTGINGGYGDGGCDNDDVDDDGGSGEGGDGGCWAVCNEYLDIQMIYI